MYPRRKKPVLAKAKCRTDRNKDAADDFNDNNMGTGSFSYDSSDDPTTKEESGDMTFCMSNYAKDSMKMMFMMRSHHMLTDVVLEVKEEQFHAHKIVLSAGSPYFKAMFTGGLKESEMSRVRLQGVCPTAMGRILYFMYSGHIRITELTVCQLLPAATMFQVPNVIDACCAFLERQLDPTNAIGIASFAEQHGCTKLKQRANQFIERHFTQICLEEEFLQLSAIQLIQLIVKDELNVQEEREVYNAVLKWVKYDGDSRYPKMEHILHAVRCQFLTPNFLKEQMSNCDVLKKAPACREYLASIFQDLTLHKRAMVRERKPNTTRMIFIAGGYYRHSLDILEAFNVDDQTWTALPSLRVPRSGLGAAFLRGQFYAVGGRNNSPGTAYDSDWVDRYDPVTEEWRPCAPMTLPRNRVGVAVMDELLYAVGGSAGSEYHDSVEHYEPDFDRWTRVQSMHYKRLGVGIAIVNRLLYAIGGFNGKERLKSCECYHPENNEWTVIPPMNVGRSGAGVAALNQYIYVVGGFDGSRQLNSVERYDTEKGVWEIQTGIDIARSALALNVLDGKLYAMGGFDGQNFLSIVEVYDPVLNKWDEGAPLTTGRSGHASAVIYHPLMASSYADSSGTQPLMGGQQQQHQHNNQQNQHQHQHQAHSVGGASSSRRSSVTMSDSGMSSDCNNTMHTLTGPRCHICCSDATDSIGEDSMSFSSSATAGTSSSMGGSSSRYVDDYLARQQMPPPAFAPPFTIEPGGRAYAEPSLTYVAPSQQRQQQHQQQQHQHRSEAMRVPLSASSSSTMSSGGYSFLPQRSADLNQAAAMMAAASSSAAAAGGSGLQQNDKKRLRVHSFNSVDALPAKIQSGSGGDDGDEAMLLDDDGVGGGDGSPNEDPRRFKRLFGVDDTDRMATDASAGAGSSSSNNSSLSEPSLPAVAGNKCDGCTVTAFTSNLQRRFRAFVQGRRSDAPPEPGETDEETDA